MGGSKKKTIACFVDDCYLPAPLKNPVCAVHRAAPDMVNSLEMVAAGKTEQSDLETIAQMILNRIKGDS